MDYGYFMERAYEQALKAYEARETPIGCVIVTEEGGIIASGYNMRNTMKNTLYHAEIIAINEASRITGDWRLDGAYLFVTLEPCPMCAGAIIQARIKEVVFAAENKKAGCAGSVTDMFAITGFNHQVKVTKGIMAEECAMLMSRFFKELRSGEKCGQ